MTSAGAVDAGLMSLLQLAGRGLPTGGFAFSDGIEHLHGTGGIASAEDLRALLEAHYALSVAAGDVWFVRAGHRLTAERHAGRLRAEALDEQASRAASAQRRASVTMGANMVRAARALAVRDEAAALDWLQAALGDVTPRAVVFGAVACIWGMGEREAAHGYAYAAIDGLADAAVRLGIVPALRGQRIVREILASDEMAASLRASPGFCSPLLDVAIMAHEATDAKLFTT